MKDGRAARGCGPRQDPDGMRREEFSNEWKIIPRFFQYWKKVFQWLENFCGRRLAEGLERLNK